MDAQTGNPSDTPNDHNQSSFLHQGKENFYQTEIPPTSRINYITGVYALNIPAAEGTTGDWHENVFWHRIGIRKPERISLGGEGEFNTNHIFGDMGVQEARKRVVRIGLYVAASIREVYVANHTRATLDLAFSEFNRFGRAMNVKGASHDWLDTPEQKENLLSHAAKLREYLVGKQLDELDSWIEYERSLD